MAMAGELSAIVQRLFDALDKGDAATATGMVGSGAQGIDEISRKWMRGPGEVTDYVRRLFTMASDVHSELLDVHEVEWDDTGVVTFWLEQDYTLEGERDHVSAPTTVVFRREGGQWKVALFHSLPLPEES
jgi:hypothetical protein